MSNMQDALNEIVQRLEEAATSVGAMEAALIEHGLISATGIDNHTAQAHIHAKHALVNARYLISRIP